MKYSLKLAALACACLIIACGGQNNPKINEVGVSKITTNSDSSLSDLINVSDLSFLKLGEHSNSVKTPKKVLKWGDYIVYQSYEPDNLGQGSLLLLDSNLEVLKEMNGSSGAPGSFKELTDFFIWKNQLYLYDFQSQKFIVFESDLETYREVRSGYYFYFLVATEAMIVAYANRKVQFVEGVNYPYDIMILDGELKPRKFLRKLNANQTSGTVLNSDRILVSGSNEVYFTPFWSDSMLQVLPDTIIPAFNIEYENPLPEQIKKLEHAELLQGIMTNKYSEYEKGASPTIVTESQILFSFGSENRLKYGVYDRTKDKSIVFDDYYYSLSEQLLKPQYLDDGLYVSFMYPYELRDYLNSGLISESSLDSQFLSELENEEQDGRLIRVRYSLRLD